MLGLATEMFPDSEEDWHDVATKQQEDESIENIAAEIRRYLKILTFFRGLGI